MPATLAWSSTAAEAALLTLAGVLVLLLAIIGYRVWQNSRITAEERERRRRELLVARGKMGDAVLVEINEHLLVYTYDVRGMEYTASQDVAALQDHIPQDISSLSSVAVKYDPKNPANSIILAEQWSGLRSTQVS